MVNPRQRRKARSGIAKASASKRSLKNQKKVTIKGPELLVKGWDRKKTVRQNYAALGLLPSLNPRQAGGLEADPNVTPFAISSATPDTLEALERSLEDDEEMDEEDEEEEETVKADKGKGKATEDAPLKPGMARIIRDEKGNVVKIIVGGENGEEIEEKVVEPSRTGAESDDEDEEESQDDEEEEKQPWGPPLKDWDAQRALEQEHGSLEGVSKKSKQGIPIFGAPLQVEAKTDIVRALEERASHKTKVIRHTSEFEHDWLVSLVAKHDEDIGKMARDRKANVWQKTPGELKRMIAKAGGFEALRAEAAAVGRS
ncbi:Nucleolar protein 16 [Rhodotorula toruloides]|uniref:Nucleolar protein 16 n=1 Tax=Rhodotorula toruloides TaxID=5286 RepID=A0A0K3CCA9_RHOTO|nr:Ribosome biogenesis protein Nop16 [Rhodotorula toruloides]